MTSTGFADSRLASFAWAVCVSIRFGLPLLPSTHFRATSEPAIRADVDADAVVAYQPVVGVVEEPIGNCRVKPDDFQGQRVPELLRRADDLSVQRSAGLEPPVPHLRGDVLPDGRVVGPYPGDGPADTT